MAEEGKMEKARAALLFGVRTLRDADRFNIVSFSGEEHLMTTGLVAADDAGRARGVEFVQSLRPAGGTNIRDSLVAGLRLFDQSERPRMLVFMTDGLPTVGETNIQRIIESARSARTAGTRLFTFGVGYDVNTALLDKLASENGGVADYVEPKEDIEIKVSGFFTKVNYPVLTDLQLDMGGVETDLVYPRAMPDLFRGTQLTLIGRYRNASDLNQVRMRLTGRTGRQTRTYTYDNLRFPFNEDDNDFLPRLWATRRVGWLMEQVRTNGEQKELRDEIVDLGTRYGIVTPYTSYLALEPGVVTVDSDEAPPPGVTSGNRVTRQRGARDSVAARPMSSSVGGSGAGAPSAPPAPLAMESMKRNTGEMAVKESKKARAQQEVLRVEGEKSETVRKVGGKTFYLREGVWVDSEFREDSRLPQTALTFGSEEYFALLKREPKLAEYFALGERVLVVYKNRVYRVTS
jgi:Ca-activated chloride channel family protein